METQVAAAVVEINLLIERVAQQSQALVAHFMETLVEMVIVEAQHKRHQAQVAVQAQLVAAVIALSTVV
jgi:hypothetical protein